MYPRDARITALLSADDAKDGLRIRSKRLRNAEAWLLVLLFFLFLLPLMGGTYWMYLESKREIERDELQSDLLYARTLSALTEQNLTSAQHILTSIADRQSFQNEWAKRDVPAIGKNLREAGDLEPAFLFVSVYETDGTMRTMQPPDAVIGWNFAYREWYRGVTAQWRPYVSGVYRTAVAPHPLVVAVAVPIRAADEKPTGILMATYSLGDLSNKLRSLEHSARANYYVVDAHRIVAASRETTELSDPVQTPAIEVTQRALAGQEGSERVRLAGKDAYVGYAPVPRLGWGVLYVRSGSDVLAPVLHLRSQFRAMTILLLLIYLATAVLAAVLIRRQANLLEANEELNCELKKQMRQTRQARVELDRYFSVGLDMFCIAGDDGYFKRLNPAWEKTLGYRVEELLARPYLDFIHPDDRAATTQQREKQSAGEDVISFANRYRCKDGSYRWLSWNATPILDEKLTYAVARDVTDLKAIEQALRQSEEWSRLLILAVQDYAIIRLDLEGRVASWNSGAERINGYAAEEILGQPFSNLYPSNNGWQSQPEDKLREAADKGRVEDEGWHLRKDGSKFWANVVITALRDEKGKLIGYSKITRDISERKRAQEALILAKEEAERSNRFKDQFLSTMSHELRTPLNAVVGFSDLLTEEHYGPLNEKQKRYVQHIQNGGKHLLRLINDILDLSKIEAGRLQLALESTSVKNTVNEVLDTMRPLADKKNHRLLQKTEAGLNVLADGTRFRQMLLNLVGNAIKFTPENGTVDISAQKLGDVVRLEVHDSGPGIPAEEQQRIFEAFYRLGCSEKAAEGTGLGLAITRRLVELHGGHLGIESHSGKGSCFFFTLPFAPEPRPAANPSVFSQIPTNENPKVLVIEDDSQSAHLLQSQLASAGYEVTICRQPERALQMAVELQPSAITLDVIMKPINGWNLLPALKSDPRTSGIPVIVVSIVDQPMTGALLGADEYIVKPVNKSNLLAALQKCLNQRGQTGRKIKILVVEDDLATRELIAELLSGNSYQVVTASDGKQGRARISDANPDLVILDLMLPEVSGFELLTELRSSARTADLPVFILTSKDLSTEEKEYIRAHKGELFRKQQKWQDELLRLLHRVVRPVIASVS